MPRLTIIFAFLLIVTLLVGCQQQVALPTPIDVNIMATQTAAPVVTRTAEQVATEQAIQATIFRAGTSTAIAQANVLPPTWTPSPTLTDVPAELAPTATLTPTPEFSTGTIYYIYQNRAIVALDAETGFQDILIEARTNMRDLTLSPDGTQLAYVADGANGEPEIFVATLDGAETQLSQFGFSRLLAPSWRPDSNALTFVASPAPSGPLDIYLVSTAGTGAGRLTDTSRANLAEVIWSPDATRLFFSAGGVYGLDLSSEQVYQLTTPTSFGPDYSLTYNVTNDEVVYLQSRYDDETGFVTGRLQSIDVAVLDDSPEVTQGVNLGAENIIWSGDGGMLLIETRDAVFVQEAVMGTSLPVAENTAVQPRATFSPDFEYVGYVDVDAELPDVPQVFVVDVSGEGGRQLTDNTEGTIASLVWGQ